MSRLFFCALLMVGLAVLPTGCGPIISLGRNPSPAEAKRFEGLPNYSGGQFQNEERNAAPALVLPASGGPRWWRLFKYLRSKPADTRPQGDLPAVVTDLKRLTVSEPTVVWFGHSSFLLKTKTATLLFDPVFNGSAGPLANLVPAFRGTTDYGPQDLPEIDALVISHDHYDHLDYKTVRRLRKKVKRVVVPLGVGGHLRRWGYPADRITELNWHEGLTLPGGVRITATPAHHRSNRTMAQRKTLWASYVVEADGRRIYFSGDTGDSGHFGRIGERYGPVDLALLECGQYNRAWPHSHLHPSQTARAAVDLKAGVVMPVHWAKFAESNHPWAEPVKLLLSSADSLGVKVTVPLMGQPWAVGDAVQRVEWWEW